MKNRAIQMSGPGFSLVAVWEDSPTGRKAIRNRLDLFLASVRDELPADNPEADR